MDPIEELALIKSILLKADEYGLREEVFRSAVREKEKHPELSPVTAMSNAFDEWIK